MKGVLPAKKTVPWAMLLMILLISFFLYLNSAAYEIYRTAKQIRSLQPALTMAIYTDVHHDPKYEVDPYQETMACIGKLMEKTPVDALWNLGDMINGQTTTKEEAILQIREVLAEENKVTSNAHRIQGNHDNNVQSTYSSNAEYGIEEVLGNDELNRLLENRVTTQTEHHSDLRSTDYYVDFDGIRVVCITADGTAFQPETAAWMKEQALQTESQVLILSHLPTRPEWGFHGLVAV